MIDNIQTMPPPKIRSRVYLFIYWFTTRSMLLFVCERHQLNLKCMQTLGKVKENILLFKKVLIK